MKDAIHTQAVIMLSEAVMHIACFVSVTFKTWVKHLQFRWRLLVVLVSTYKQITQKPADFTYLFIHHHTLHNVTKWSINMIRASIVICNFIKQLVQANSIFKPYIHSKEHAYLQLLWQSYTLWNRATLLSVLTNSQN